MEMVYLICPNCHANLEFEEGNQIIQCKYCGSKAFLDNDTKTTKHVRTVNVNKYNMTTIREAEIKKDIRLQELKEERRKEKQDIRIVMIVIIMFISLFGIIGIKEYSDNNKVKMMKNKGMISAGYYEDYLGEKYKGVISKLKALGFSNIETVDLDDSGFFKNKKDTIESISIDGTSNFYSTDYFNPTDKIVIAYH